MSNDVITLKFLSYTAKLFSERLHQLLNLLLVNEKVCINRPLLALNIIIILIC